MGSNRNLSALYPAFRERYELVLAELNAYLCKHHPGMTAKLVEGFRTTAYQQELYAKGRTAPGKKVTNCDGVKNRSNHQSSLAADVGFFKDGKYIDEPGDEIMAFYGHCVRAHGLRWGGNWGKIVDQPHAEWNTSDKATYAAAREWQKAQGLR